jgi:cystathionine beta-lyase/cystathionine gamma-synthase
MSEKNGGKTEETLRSPTKILTKGFDPSLSVGSARPAVFRSSTYVFSSPESAERAFEIASGASPVRKGEKVELIYARMNHPNAEILEAQTVPLEPEAQAALVFNSGMAAITTSLLTFLRPGQSMIYTVPVYGGTQHFVRDFLPNWGVKSIPVLAGNGQEIDDAIRSAKNLGVVLVETPTNPTLRMTDIHRLCRTVSSLNGSSGHRRPLVMVDNTFLGPTFQHPLTLGADLVLYSATKYLSGFSDLLAGMVLAKNPDLIEPIRQLRHSFGNILQPDECWMLDGRLPTVTLRMNRASKNAQRIAEQLAQHPKIERVIYPSLFTDPEQQRIFRAQCAFPGAMLSLELKGGKPAAFEFLRNLHLARNAVSLGGVETLACHPRTTTHSTYTDEEAREAGVTDGLVRISVGIEHWRDILGDIEQSLDKL